LEAVESDGPENKFKKFLEAVVLRNHTCVK